MPRPSVEPERRRQIVDAAIRVFADRGLAAARMEDVAAAAGIAKGTIYLYYPSKEALALAIVDRLYGGDAARVRAESGEGTAEARLRRLAAGLVAATVAGRELLPLVMDIYSLGARDAAVRARLDEYFAAYRDQVRQILLDGQQHGEIDCPTGVDSAALAIVAAFEGVFWLWVIGDMKLDLGQVLDEAVSTFLRGVAE